MPKRDVTNYNIDTMQPDEVNALKSLVKEFVSRLQVIDQEIELLKDDRKQLVEEFKSKLDMKTLQAALRVAKIEQSIEHKDTFDTFLDVLKGEN